MNWISSSIRSLRNVLSGEASGHGFGGLLPVPVCKYPVDVPLILLA